MNMSAHGVTGTYNCCLSITGKEMFEVDEHPRPKTNMDILGKLPPVFKKGGTVTAGNASVSCSEPCSIKKA